MCEQYNGYVNYQTWVTSLWLDNDQGSYSHWLGIAKELVEDDADTASWELGKLIKEYHEEFKPTEVSGVYSDLLQHALDSVDWEEVAESFVESAKEEMEEEED